MVLQLNYRTTLNEIIKHHVEIGVEVEKHRVTQNQSLSLKPFPENLSRDIQPYVKREFCTAQLEFTLPHSADPDLNVNLIGAVIKEVAQQLKPEEQIWHYSCPPQIPCPLEEVPISQVPEESNEYRRQSVLKHDVRRLLNNGTHINFSFSQEAIAYLMRELHFATRDDLYLQIAQYFMINRWLLTYLFGATPFADQDYFDQYHLCGPVRSIRSSSLGFPNETRGDYRSVRHYIAAIDQAVANGELLQPREYYESVRLKSGNSKDPNRILKYGITHLELRTFDLNPLTISAVTPEQIRFIQLLALYFAYQPRLSGSQIQQLLAVAAEMNEQVALEAPTQQCAYATQGLTLLTELADFVERQQLEATFSEVLDQFRDCFIDADQTLAVQVLAQFDTY